MISKKIKENIGSGITLTSNIKSIIFLFLFLLAFIRVPFINTMVLLPINLKKYK